MRTRSECGEQNNEDYKDWQMPMQWMQQLIKRKTRKKKHLRRYVLKFQAAHRSGGCISRLPTFQVSYKSGGRYERNMPTCQHTKVMQKKHK